MLCQTVASVAPRSLLNLISAQTRSVDNWYVAAATSLWQGACLKGWPEQGESHVVAPTEPTEPTDEQLEYLRSLPPNTKLTCDRPGCENWFVLNMTPMLLGKADPRDTAKQLLDHQATHEK